MKWILLPIALLLLWAIMPLGFLFAMFFRGRVDYCYQIALSIDQLGNVICSRLFNATLGNGFGSEDETISSVLGKNKAKNTLTFLGKTLAFILNKIDKKHVEKSIGN